MHFQESNFNFNFFFFLAAGHLQRVPDCGSYEIFERRTPQTRQVGI
jgi:hypothetical protein